MKNLQGATLAMLGALLLSGTALAQPHSVAPRPIPNPDHSEYIVVEGGAHHHDHHGGCCSRGGCFPPESGPCDPCGPHGLNQLFARMKQKLCERKCRCAKRCDKVCCTEPACDTVETCCPHPTSYAPELAAYRKPLLLGRLFQDKCATGYCGGPVYGAPPHAARVYGAPMREGCCAPVIHRGGYPQPPQPVEQLEPTPHHPASPAAPATERTSGERRYETQKNVRSSRGPI